MVVGLILLAAQVTPDSQQAAGARAEADPEEIVVTGERVARSLRETPSSVEVLTRSDIEARGDDRIEHALEMVPNVTLGSGSQGPAIRGLDTTGPLQALPAFLGGNRPRTTIIVDGRPVNYNEFVFATTPLWDLDRVEVYRSPQTTTQGQNSIAGAIFLLSEDPTFEPEGRLRLIGGDYRTGQLSALVSGPLSPDMAFRAAGDLRYSRTTSRISDVMAGADPNHDVFGLIRGKLLIEPSRLPDSRLLVTVTHSLSQAPQTEGVSAPFRDRRDDAPNYGVFRVRADSMTMSFRHRFGSSASASLVISAGDSSARRFAFPGFGETQSDATDWSGEVLLNWNAGGPISGVVGLAHNQVRLRQKIDLSLLSGLTGRFRDRQDGTGLFGEATLRIAPRATLTAGLRYQVDRQERSGALVTNAFSVPADFVGTFSKLLPKLSLTYELSPAWRAGLLIQKAYNPGGTTIRFDTARPDTFAAETLWDTELFARGSLAGGRLGVRLNAFNYAMRNAQRADPIIITTPTGRRVGFANLFNVPRARSRGLEAAVDMRVRPELTVQGSIGLLATRITGTDPESALYDGKQFDRSPHFTGAVSIGWRPIPALTVSAHARRHSGYFSDNANQPQLRVPGATIADLQARYERGRVAFFVQARNVFDKFAMLTLATPASGQAAEPRRITAGIETRF